MAVSKKMLDMARFAVRRAAGDKNVDAELRDLVEQAREEMIVSGVPKMVAENDGNPMVRGAIRCFVRWKFGIGGDDAAQNHEAYIDILEQLRKAVR